MTPRFAQYSENVTKVAKHEKDFIILKSMLTTILKNISKIISHFPYRRIHENAISKQ